ncbi:MAG TPA: hypothetical protein VMK13_06620 [Streptosporangiaceae bacterium]|nr:hypothetical protein [Streptosporangiaceae bacterium]
MTVVVDREEMSGTSGRDTVFAWHGAGSGTVGAVTASARDVEDFQPFLAPGDHRTVLDGPPGTYGFCKPGAAGSRHPAARSPGPEGAASGPAREGSRP